MTKNTVNLVRCALFVALIIIGAFVKIPVPMVPFTLQFLFTTLSGLLLGARYGALTVCVYILLGLLGLPVFSEGGGLSYVLKPSFGYIIGFALGTFVTGKIAWKAQKPSYLRLLGANFAGLTVVYALGMAYYALISDFYLHNPIGLFPLFLYCFAMVVPGDAVLCVLAAFIAKRLLPVMRKKVI